MQNRTIYDIKEELRQVEGRISFAIFSLILSLVFLIPFLVGGVMMQDIKAILLAIMPGLMLLLSMAYFFDNVPSGLKKRRALREELKLLETRDVKFTVQTSGLDADEWSYSGGRKKKKKHKEIDSEE